jgi:hypothetical protein
MKWRRLKAAWEKNIRDIVTLIQITSTVVVKCTATNKGVMERLRLSEGPVRAARAVKDSTKPSKSNRTIFPYARTQTMNMMEDVFKERGIVYIIDEYIENRNMKFFAWWSRKLYCQMGESGWRKVHSIEYAYDQQFSSVYNTRVTRYNDVRLKLNTPTALCPRVRRKSIQMQHSRYRPVYEEKKNNEKKDNEKEEQRRQKAFQDLWENMVKEWRECVQTLGPVIQRYNIIVPPLNKYALAEEWKVEGDRWRRLLESLPDP